MTIVSNGLVILVVTVVASYGQFNPCQNYQHGQEKHLFPDPLDCSKFYKCQGKTPHHLDCAAGTSFDDNWRNGFGSCTGPDPRYVPDCYSDDRDERFQNKRLNWIVLGPFRISFSMHDSDKAPVSC